MKKLAIAVITAALTTGCASPKPQPATAAQPPSPAAASSAPSLPQAPTTATTCAPKTERAMELERLEAWGRANLEGTLIAALPHHDGAWVEMKRPNGDVETVRLKRTWPEGSWLLEEEPASEQEVSARPVVRALRAMVPDGVVLAHLRIFRSDSERTVLGFSFTDADASGARNDYVPGHILFEPTGDDPSQPSSWKPRKPPLLAERLARHSAIASALNAEGRALSLVRNSWPHPDGKMLEIDTVDCEGKKAQSMYVAAGYEGPPKDLVLTDAHMNVSEFYAKHRTAIGTAIDAHLDRLGIEMTMLRGNSDYRHLVLYMGDDDTPRMTVVGVEITGDDPLSPSSLTTSTLQPDGVQRSQLVVYRALSAAARAEGASVEKFYAISKSGFILHDRSHILVSTIVKDAKGQRTRRHTRLDRVPAKPHTEAAGWKVTWTKSTLLADETKP